MQVNFMNGEKKWLKGLKTDYFQFIMIEIMRNEWSLKKKKKKEERTFNATKFNEWVNKQETDINRELFKKHFNFQRPSDVKISMQSKY